jgi:hypothetical protein
MSKPPHEIIVVDADGKVLSRSKKVKPALTRGNRIKEDPPVNPTIEDLNKLEDVIYQTRPEFKEEEDPWRVGFLQVYKEMYHETIPSMEFYLSKIHAKKMQALLHCWNEFNWRYRKDMKGIYVHNKANPYTK